LEEIKMELYEAIEKRRTIRVFKSPATEGQLKKIILAGTKAPSAMNSQPWEFVIVEEKSLVDKLADLKFQVTFRVGQAGGSDKDISMQKALTQKESFGNASIVAVFHRKGQDASIWAAIENISLAAVAEGLGSGIAFYAPEERLMIVELLGLPGNYELSAVLKIGLPAEEGYPRENIPYGPRRPEFSWLHRNRF
jgi:5,6-dimethylbenzimidazole synthase